ncbi:MAG: DAK2 domain-containing protein [Oscillospiraceae bacterium]|nr:DAK2 domain-containing protein [Oscillospiraceae bacterium]
MMKTEILDGALYQKLIIGGAANLQRNRKTVNDLNVFPIPDGDTGDNMFMTMDAGAAMLRGESGISLGEAAELAARGMLLGARGNSGVITSRIFAGISKGLEGTERATTAVLTRALERGVREAYEAVSVPVEGTILTVYRDAVRFAGSRINGDSDFNRYFDDFIEEMERSLERTPELLAVLREAGVVDSGGAGLLYIAEGMKAALSGKESGESIVDTPTQKRVDVNMFTEDSILEFGYCTEFLLRLQTSKIDVNAFDLDAFIEWLNANGDSVVAFRDGTIVKAHVHTKRPGDIFNYCQNFGEFLTTKVENMTLQHNEHTAPDRFAKAKKPKKPYGIVSVAAGRGIKTTLLEMGCDAVVDGGQSMNPSTEDFIKAFDTVNADTILVFPNNKNIILAANQAAELYKKAEVRVVPTRTVGEGYCAIAQLDTSSGDTEAIITELREIISGVVTGVVSRAVRDTEKDGVSVKKDDYIGFSGGKISVDDPDRVAAALTLADNLGAGDYDLLILVRGEAVPREETAALAKELGAKYPMSEVITIDGEQPVYDYIMILE